MATLTNYWLLVVYASPGSSEFCLFVCLFRFCWCYHFRAANIVACQYIYMHDLLEFDRPPHLFSGSSATLGEISMFPSLQITYGRVFPEVSALASKGRGLGSISLIEITHQPLHPCIHGSFGTKMFSAVADMIAWALHQAGIQHLLHYLDDFSSPVYFRERG